MNPQVKFYPSFLVKIDFPTSKVNMTNHSQETTKTQFQYRFTLPPQN